MFVKTRLSNGTLSDLNIENISELSVRQLKELISNSYGEDIESMRLVVRGRILKDDEERLLTYNIQEMDTIYVAKTKSSTSPSAANPSLVTASASSPSGKAADPMADMMSHPLMESMMSNPQFMRSILQSNPQFQRMIEEMPELREAMNDPSFFTELTKASRNPSLRAEMMRNQDRTLANIESMPGGMQHLSSMFKSMDRSSSFKPPDSTEEGDRRLAAQLLGPNSSPSTSGPNSEALPNPWAPRPPKRTNIPISSSIPMLPFGATSPSGLSSFSPYMNMLQQRASKSGESSAASLSSSSVPPFSLFPSPRAAAITMEPIESRYKEQLDTLKDMGFTNEDQNKRAIIESKGNLDGAVEIILSQTPEAFM